MHLIWQSKMAFSSSGYIFFCPHISSSFSLLESSWPISRLCNTQLPTAIAAVGGIIFQHSLMPSLSSICKLSYLLDLFIHESSARQANSLKNIPYLLQGAATTVWAAISSELEGKGGLYLENCSVALPAEEGKSGAYMPGYQPYIYDEQASARLWKISNTFVGLPEDE